MRSSPKSYKRELRPGELVPTDPPTSRWKTPAGYIRVNWRLSMRVFLETYEHRIRDGRIVGAGMVVHHRNGVKDDNRPENLELMTAKEHLRHHHYRFDVNEAALLYEQGHSTVAVGKALGVDASNVLRALRFRGVKIRSPQEGAALARRTA